MNHDNRLTMAWDGKDRVRYRYDALGRRVQRVVSTRGENTKFIYDGDDVLVDDNNGVLTKYINGQRRSWECKMHNANCKIREKCNVGSWLVQ